MGTDPKSESSGWRAQFLKKGILDSCSDLDLAGGMALLVCNQNGKVSTCILLFFISRDQAIRESKGFPFMNRRNKPRAGSKKRTNSIPSPSIHSLRVGIRSIWIEKSMFWPPPYIGRLPEVLHPRVVLSFPLDRISNREFHKEKKENRWGIPCFISSSGGGEILVLKPFPFQWLKSLLNQKQDLKRWILHP